MNITARLKTLTNKLSYSFKRFPIPLLFAALVVGILIFINHSDFRQEETIEMYSRVAMVLALGIPLSLSLDVFFEGGSESLAFHQFFPLRFPYISIYAPEHS